MKKLRQFCLTKLFIGFAYILILNQFSIGFYFIFALIFSTDSIETFAIPAILAVVKFSSLGSELCFR
jgi:hypothetical protein